MEIEELDTIMVYLQGCRVPDLPKESFAWVEDPEKKSTWHLPIKDKDGKVKCECIRAAIAAIGGARSGKPMAGVPEKSKDLIRRLAKECKIDTDFDAYTTVKYSTPVQLKQVDNILKVNGTILEVGEFTGSDGVTTTFDTQSIKNIYGNLTKNIKFIFTHDRPGACPIVAGFAYKYGLSDDETKIEYEGLVFDPLTIQQLSIGEHDSASLEASFEVDSDTGYASTGVINNIAFVQNPAVPSASVNITPVQFSAEKEDQPHKEEDDMADTDERDTRITELEAEIVVKDAQLEEFRGEFDAIQTKEFEVVKNSVIELGMKDPDKLVEGLELPQQIEVLKRFQASLLASKKDTTPPADMPGDVPDKDKEFATMIKELGIEDRVKELLPDMVGGK
jgi:hypothetical protein